MLIDEDFDRPVFKLLARNDTGAAAGHQSGFVIPKDLDEFFPQLGSVASASNPTPSEQVTAQLFLGDKFIDEVETRYQYQTWGGTRSPERRMTGNLAPLLRSATVDDLLLIQRGLANPQSYRFRLIKQGAPEYAGFIATLGGRRWGALQAIDPPVSERQVEQAIAEEEKTEASPFVAIDANAKRQESRTLRLARSRAFQRTLCRIYDLTCAICQNAIRDLDGQTEAEAAHIIPRSLKGSDDARNGLLLCRTHHWAYDRGLIGVKDDFQIVVPEPVLAIAANAALKALQGTRISLPNDAKLLPHREALTWHRKYHGLQ